MLWLISLHNAQARNSRHGTRTADSRELFDGESTQQCAEFCARNLSRLLPTIAAIGTAGWPPVKARRPFSRVRGYLEARLLASPVSAISSRSWSCARAKRGFGTGSCLPRTARTAATWRLNDLLESRTCTLTAKLNKPAVNASKALISTFGAVL